MRDRRDGRGTATSRLLGRQVRHKESHYAIGAAAAKATGAGVRTAAKQCRFLRADNQHSLSLSGKPYVSYGVIRVRFRANLFKLSGGPRSVVAAFRVVGLGAPKETHRTRRSASLQHRNLVPTRPFSRRPRLRLVADGGFLPAVQSPADRSLPVAPPATIVCRMLTGQTMCSGSGRLIFN